MYQLKQMRWKQYCSASAWLLWQHFLPLHPTLPVPLCPKWDESKTWANCQASQFYTDGGPWESLSVSVLAQSCFFQDVFPERTSPQQDLAQLTDSAMSAGLFQNMCKNFNQWATEILLLSHWIFTFFPVVCWKIRTHEYQIHLLHFYTSHIGSTIPGSLLASGNWAASVVP